MQQAKQNKPERKPRLYSESKLILMTRQAQRLVYGRALHSTEKNTVPPIVGLFNFASLLRMIWLGTQKDDPYADLWLIRVHQALQDGGQELLRFQTELDALYEKVPSGVDVRLAVSASPMEVPLRFATPYAFTGAYLLCGFDQFMRKILTARHVGILSYAATNRDQNRAAKLVRRTYLSATGYRFTGVTRADIIGNTTRAVFAARQMGMVPKSVLEGMERAPHAFPPRTSPPAQISPPETRPDTGSVATPV